MKFFKSFLPLFLAFTISVYAQTTYTWFGGDGDWESESNWSPNGIPGYMDTAIIDSGIITLTNADSIANLELAGTLTGIFHLTVLGEMIWTAGEMTGFGTTIIAEDATFRWKGAAEQYLTSARKLINYGTVIWESGNVYLAYGLAFTNYGTFLDEIEDNQIMRSTTLESKFNNNGLYSKTGSAESILWINLVNNGRMDLQSGKTRLYSGSITSNDSILVSENALLTISTTYMYLNGSVSGAGMVDFNGNNTTVSNSYNISGQTIFSKGLTTFDNNSSIENLGDEAATEIGRDATVNFSTGKPLSLDSLVINGGGISGNDPLTITKSLYLSGSQGVLMGSSPLIISVGAIFTINHGNQMTVSRQIDNYGTSIWKSGYMEYYGGVDFNNYGVFLDSLKYSRIFRLKQDGSIFNNIGTYIKSGVMESHMQLPFDNKPGGLLGGSGIIKMLGGMTNNGTVSPGDLIGILIIHGSFPAAASSSLEIEISGLTAGTEYDQMQISETASLGGTLNIKLLNDFLPQVGDEFQIMTFASGSGSFDTINGLDTGKGVAFEVVQSETGVKLAAVEATPNTPPSTFNLISPIDATVLGTILTIDFIWQASSDAEGDSLFYDLNIIGGALDTSITHIVDTLFTFISQNRLEYNTSYNWTVTVTDGISKVASPDNFSFTTPLPDDIGEKGLNMPEKFNLAQNYPNPFNPVTTIQYELPVTNYVILKIYDLAGRELETLVNGIRHAGRHAVVFNSTGLASGVYFYQLQASAGFMQTRKLILLR